MTSSEKLLALYDEIIVNRFIDEKVTMQAWHGRYKNFIETVRARTVELKKGKKLDYDNGDQEFLDLFFISNNPVSSRGSNPISDEDLRKILRNNEFLELIEENMLNPNRRSWDTLIVKGKSIFKQSGFDNQPLRFNRISASCTINLIPMPSQNAFNKFVKYLNDNAILDFTNIEKNWYVQNEYLTKEIHEVFSNKILDENDFTDEYWLNLFAWSLYDKKVNQSESDVKNTETKPNTGTKKMEDSLNRILFGAAGTGKTYHTINHALSIIENKSLEELKNNTREELKNLFKFYKEQGQIKFVTFHQSFSYEDFVEGIRAETNQQGQLRYEIKAGVFKEICDQAKQIGTNQKLTQVSQPIEFGKGYILKKMNAELLEIQKPNGNVIHLSRVLSDFLLKEFRNGKITDRDLAGKKVIEILDESEILEPYLVNGYSAIWANLIPFLDNLLHSVKPVVKEKSKYVIIIDEINRGNISRIFGELITLIEDSKRQGADEELSVTLPYSKEEFSVPNNVYIIGTMNSSDRSLTGLDIALRRRFIFIEMQSQPLEIKNEDGELIRIIGKDKDGNDKQVVIADIVSIMNQRIEVLLDRDHCIGHANFMSLRKTPTLVHLADIFKQKIIPQLQEYFFDDWEKINMVLFNNEMIIEEKINIAELFPPNTGEDIHYSEQKKIWKINEDAFKTVDAFVNILGSKG